MTKTRSFFAGLIIVIVLAVGFFWMALNQNSLAAFSTPNHPDAEFGTAGVSTSSSLAQTSASDAESDELPPANLVTEADAAFVLPTPIPGETLVYFVPTDNDATGTVLYLYNTDTVTHTVALRGFNYDGAMVYAQNITVLASSFLRLTSDSIAAAPPPSWATPAPVVTNFTDFVYFASLSLPNGVKAEGYALFNPGTGTEDPRKDQGAIPLHMAAVTAGITVHSAGNGSGEVTSSPPGIDCGATCSRVYTSGTQITLTATADVSSEFSGWSGACTGTNTDCQVTLDADDVVTATFQLKTFALDVNTTGSGSGSVTSSPAGIDCGSTCMQDYEIDTPITLTAVPDANSEFVGWGGACSGSQNTCNVTLTDALSVTAEFALKEFALNVQTDGHGNVVSSPAGIDCGSTCMHDYAIDTQITLTAAPDADSEFVGWGGACSGSQNTCNVTLTDALSVTAEFALKTVTLKEFTLDVQTDGLGNVVSSPAGIDCGTQCSHPYTVGTQVTLTAQPSDGWEFDSWAGDCSGDKPDCTVTMSDGKAVTAKFRLQGLHLPEISK